MQVGFIPANRMVNPTGEIGRATAMEFTKDKDELYRHFSKDPVLFGYHIGDLDPFYFDHCRWAVNRDSDGRIEDVVLIYNGLSVPTVLAFGMGSSFESLLKDVLPHVPARFYCHFQSEYGRVVRELFTERSLGHHHKMKLASYNPFRSGIHAESIIRLDSRQLEQLISLYDKSYPGNYFDQRLLKTEKYFGYLHNDRLVSVSGVHVYSDEYRIAVLGNIATDPEHRGRGLATALTARLVDELVGEGKRVMLNVSAENEPAIKCYKKLGFEKVHEYEESVFARDQIEQAG
jgi:RimJ/RimL family protein N-acetyltransferase